MTTPTNNTLSQRPPTGDYESGKLNSEIELQKTVKTLKTKVQSLKEDNKGLKDENKIIKQELTSKGQTIDKLEKFVVKLQNDETHKKQMLEVTNDLKRAEMKLRKMKERRNHYRNEKDTMKVQVEEMQKDNEALFE